METKNGQKWRKKHVWFIRMDQSEFNVWIYLELTDKILQNLSDSFFLWEMCRFALIWKIFLKILSWVEFWNPQFFDDSRERMYCELLKNPTNHMDFLAGPFKINFILLTIWILFVILFDRRMLFFFGQERKSWNLYKWRKKNTWISYWALKERISLENFKKLKEWKRGDTKKAWEKITLIL